MRCSLEAYDNGYDIILYDLNPLIWFYYNHSDSSDIFNDMFDDKS